MKLKALFLLLIFIVLFSLPVSAENLRENPSLYSFSEIVQKLPKMWMANPIEVLEMMKDYPDFSCTREAGIIFCHSVNNRTCAEIFVELNFTSEDNYAEFDHVTFSTKVNNTEDIQKIVETFWLDDFEPANISGAAYPDGQLTLYFSNENTLLTYAIPFGESGVKQLRAEFGYIRG